MTLARKPNAKYGAKIPVAPSTGAKQARPAKQREVANPSSKVEQTTKKSGVKMR